MEDTFEDVFDEETLRLMERFQAETETGHMGFYDVDEYVLLVGALIGIGRFEDAAGLLQLAMEQYPEAVELKLKQAELCLEMDFFDQSLRWLAQVEKVEPYLYEIYLIKGHVFKAQERFDEAKASFEKAVRLGAENMEVNLALAEIAFRCKTGNVWEFLQKSIGNEGDTTDTCNRYIDLAQQADLLPEAISRIHQVIKENPYSVLYWKTLAELCEAAGLYEQALEADDFVLAIRERDRETLWHKMNLLDKIDTDESFLDFYKMMETECGDDPEMLKEVWIRLAREYEIDEIWDQAQSYYRKILDFSEVRQYAFFRLGVIANYLCEFQNALAYFDQALLEEDSGTEGPLANRAKLYHAKARTCYYMGDVTNMMRYDAEALETDPSNPTLYMTYAMDALLCDDLPKALAFVSEILERESPVPGAACIAYALLLHRTGRKDEALAYFVKGLSSVETAQGIDRRAEEYISADRDLNRLYRNAGFGEDGHLSDEEYLYYGPELPFGISWI